MIQYKSLYELEKEYLEIINILEENGGELTSELEESITINKNELNEKIGKYFNLIAELENINNAIKSEVKRLNSKILNKEKTINILQNAVKNATILFGKEEFTKKGNKAYLLELEDLSIRLSPSESVIITDENVIPQEFINTTTKIITSVDKKAIKTAIEQGVDINGCYIEVKHNVNFK